MLKSQEKIVENKSEGKTDNNFLNKKRERDQGNNNIHK